MGIKTLETVRRRLRERPEELKTARAAGKKVLGWSGYNIPEEIIYALGFIPIRIATGGDDRLVELGARYISTKNCVYLRELIGLFAENADPYIQNIDVVAFDTTCLQTFRAAELVEFYFKKDVVVLGVPRNFYWEEAKQYFVKETLYFTKELEQRAGAALDHQKLIDAVILFDKIRETLKKIYDYQAAKENIIAWDEVYDLIQAGYYLDRQEYLSLLQQVLVELQACQKEFTIEAAENEARIFISGSVIPPNDRKLIHIIKQSGGRIVGDDLWSGIAPYLDLKITEVSPAGVALGYLNRTPHAALPYLDLKSDQRLKKLHESIETYQAQGVIYHTLRYCDPYTFKAKETKDILGESQIPLLEIHTEYAGSDVEAIRTRVEAFVEMLKNRSIDKKEEIA